MLNESIDSQNTSAPAATQELPPLLRVLLEDSGAGVAVLDDAGRVLLANALFHELLGAAHERGQAIGEILPPPLGDEYARAVREALALGAPVRIHGLVDGVMLLASFRRVAGAEAGRPEPELVFAVVRSLAGRCAEAEALGSRRTIDAEACPLAQLTAREREVLRYIGLGLSTAEIAKTLHRSVKTIEWHRVALGSKLGASNRVELARIAIRAGISEIAGGNGSVDGEAPR